MTAEEQEAEEQRIRAKVKRAADKFHAPEKRNNRIIKIIFIAIVLIAIISYLYFDILL